MAPVGKHVHVTVRIIDPRTIECRHCGVVASKRKNGVQRCGAAVRQQKGTYRLNGYLITGGVRDHRTVMAEILGRPLEAHETVHHKNGDRADNGPENLELWSTWQPPGQRVEDKVQWAREVLAMYGP